MYTPARIDLSSGIPEPRACLFTCPAHAATADKTIANASHTI